MRFASSPASGEIPSNASAISAACTTKRRFSFDPMPSFSTATSFAWASSMAGRGSSSDLRKSPRTQALSPQPVQRSAAFRSTLCPLFLPLLPSPGLPRWPGGVHLLDLADVLVPLPDRRQALRASEKQKDLEFLWRVTMLEVTVVI